MHRRVLIGAFGAAVSPQPCWRPTRRRRGSQLRHRPGRRLACGPRPGHAPVRRGHSAGRLVLPGPAPPGPLPLLGRSLALDFRIRGFVRCEPVEQYADGSVGAFCSVGSIRLGDDEDLGAYLIARGHAFAAPWAPYEYAILQELAKVNRRGLWGGALSYGSPWW